MAFEYGESYYGLRTFGSSAGDVKDASATVSVAATIVSAALKVRIAGATVSVAASLVALGEEFILEESSAFTYGSGLYGANQYGTEDLQTVVTATASVTATCIRVRLAGALSAGASSITTIGEEVHLGSAAVSATSTITAEAIISVAAAGALTSTSTISATCNRVQFASGIVSVTSGTATIGREKWEIISVTPITWTPVVNDSVTWTQIAA